MNPWHGMNRETVVDIYRFAARSLETEEELTPEQVSQAISHLRWVLRRSISGGGPANLVELSSQPELCASIFREPGGVSHDYVSRCQATLADFLHLTIGADAAAQRLEAIEARLIPRPVRGWHQVERIGGGRRTTEASTRLLFAVDLLALLQKAGEGKSVERALRDRSLVALHCCSGLRTKEIVRLCWEQVSCEDLNPDAIFGASVRCPRNGVKLDLPVHRQATQPLGLLYAVTKEGTGREPTGPVFRALRSPYEPLSSRSVKEIVDQALTKAGLQGNRRDLLAAYAHHLMTIHGYTILDLTEILGYVDPQSVRRLVRNHRTWQLNRKVDEDGGLFGDAIG